MINFFSLPNRFTSFIFLVLSQRFYSRGSSIVMFNGKNDNDICAAEKNMALNRRN